MVDGIDPVRAEKPVYCCPGCGRRFDSLDGYARHTWDYNSAAVARAEANVGRYMVNRYWNAVVRVRSANPCTGTIDCDCLKVSVEDDSVRVDLSARYSLAVDGFDPIRTEDVRPFVEGMVADEVRAVFGRQFSVPEEPEAPGLPMQPRKGAPEPIVERREGFACPLCGGWFPDERSFRSHIDACRAEQEARGARGSIVMVLAGREGLSPTVCCVRDVDGRSLETVGVIGSWSKAEGRTRNYWLDFYEWTVRRESVVPAREGYDPVAEYTAEALERTGEILDVFMEDEGESE